MIIIYINSLFRADKIFLKKNYKNFSKPLDKFMTMWYNIITTDKNCGWFLFYAYCFVKVVRKRGFDGFIFNKLSKM